MLRHRLSNAKMAGASLPASAERSSVGSGLPSVFGPGGPSVVAPKPGLAVPGLAVPKPRGPSHTVVPPKAPGPLNLAEAGGKKNEEREREREIVQCASTAAKTFVRRPPKLRLRSWPRRHPPRGVPWPGPWGRLLVLAGWPLAARSARSARFSGPLPRKRLRRPALRSARTSKS